MSSPIERGRSLVRFEATPHPVSFKKMCMVCGKLSHRVVKVIQKSDGNAYICSAVCLEFFHNKLSPQRPLRR
jgi:hypothetical protein